MSASLLACTAVVPNGIAGFYFIAIVIGMAAAPYVAGALALALAFKGILSLARRA